MKMSMTMMSMKMSMMGTATQRALQFSQMNQLKFR